MARTSIPCALRKVNDSIAVPSGSLPKGARVTPDLPAARAGSGLLCAPAEPPAYEQQDAGHRETRTACTHPTPPPHYPCLRSTQRSIIRHIIWQERTPPRRPTMATLAAGCMARSSIPSAAASSVARSGPGSSCPPTPLCARAAPCCAKRSRSWPPRGSSSRGRRRAPACGRPSPGTSSIPTSWPGSRKACRSRSS